MIEFLVYFVCFRGVAICRPGVLAYVVAFANRGAKDVTQRYVASVLAAEKLRDNAWWEETLRPLRKNEASDQGLCCNKKSKAKTIPCGVLLLRSQILYWAWRAALNMIHCSSLSLCSRSHDALKGVLRI